MTPNGTQFSIGVDVEQWVRDAVRSLNVDSDDILRRFSFRHLDDKYAAFIKAVGKVKTVDAKQMDSGQILCEVEVECRITIHVGQMDEIGEENRDAITTMLLTIDPKEGSVVSNSWDVRPRHPR